MALVKDVVVSSWNGFERGDPVKVNFQRGSFTFYSARLSETGECKWVTVIGGTWQHSKYRHFVPGLISPIKTSKKASKREH
jgi:hypothetical protein